MITLSIDMNLVDQARLKSFTKKNGSQASYLELVLIETPNGKYGDYLVKQSISKEERNDKVEMPILGNGKNFSFKPKEPINNTGNPPMRLAASDDGVPF